MNVKMWVAVVASAVLAFLLTFSLVPRRPPTWVTPRLFELPGTPVSIDGTPVRDWEEANKVLQRIAKEGHYKFLEQDGRMPTELELQPVQVTYLPRCGGTFGATEPATVEVRPFLPVSIDYSRAPMDYHLRYELVRPEPSN